MGGNREWRLLLQEQYVETQPQVSPDGRWMAYASDESGQPQVYVRPFPEVDKGWWQVSTSGGDSPLWSRDGRELVVCVKFCKSIWNPFQATPRAGKVQQESHKNLLLIGN